MAGLGQALAQRRTGPVQPRLERADGDLRDDGDLRQRIALDIVQQHQLALECGQPVERGLQALAGQCTLERLVR